MKIFALNKIARYWSSFFRPSESLWAEADIALAAGNIQDAEAIYRRLSKRRKETVRNYLYSALSEQRLKNTDKALRILDLGLKRYPGTEDLIEHYFRICVQRGELDRAIGILGFGGITQNQAFEKILHLKFCDSTIRRELIDYCLNNSLVDGAKLFLEHSQQKSFDVRSRWMLADLFYHHKRKDEEKLIYQEISRHKPIDPESYLYVALAQYRLNEPDKAIEILSEGLSLYPDAEYLFEHYCRLCAENGDLARVIRFIDRDITKQTEVYEKILSLEFVDLTIRMSLIDYGLDNNLVELAARDLNYLLDNHNDVTTLWKLADLLLRHGRNTEAESIYTQLSVRTPVDSDTFYYSGLAQIRLNNPVKSLEILEAGIIQYPDINQLFALYVQCCAVSCEFTRCFGFIKEHELGGLNLTSTPLDFYRLAYKHGGLSTFITSLKYLGLRLNADDLNTLKSEILDAVACAPPAYNDAKLILFYCKYLDVDVEFTSRLHNIIKSSLTHSRGNSESANHLLRLIYNFTLPMIPHYAGDLEATVNQFIMAGQSLLSDAVEANEPISDMTNNWTPWQYIFCAAIPAHLYAKALSALEQALFKTWPQLNYTAPHIYEQDDPGIKTDRKIRIGFIVHDSMPMMSGLLAHLDKGIFETIFLRPGKGAQSRVAKNWVERADKTIEYSDTNSYQAIKTIANQKLDILVGGPATAAVFYPLMARLAPLQMVLLEPHWMNGLTNTDYYISWQPAEPKNPDEFYKSAVSFLQHPPYWIERPSLNIDLPVSESIRLDTRKRLLRSGPDDRVYLCANSTPKIHPEMDDIFYELLDRDPKATLVILRSEYPPANSLKIRLHEKLGNYYERIVFLPTLTMDDAHLLLTSVDCCLDSHPICGMSSSFDGAMLGVPIVTLPSNIPFGRWTAAIYEYIGVSGLIAATVNDYINIAMKIATDKVWREQKMVEIREKASRYIESEVSGNEFEDFILRAWNRRLAGLPPTHWIQGNWRERKNFQAACLPQHSHYTKEMRSEIVGAE